MRTVYRSSALTSLIIAALAVPAAFAAENYAPPKTAFGVPDVQGVWNYKTRTGLERADIYEGELEVDEATMLEKMVSTPDFIAFLEATGAEAPGPENVGGYNGFWITPGDALAQMNGKYRTSLIVDPPDGKIPWRKRGKRCGNRNAKNFPWAWPRVMDPKAEHYRTVVWLASPQRRHS